MRSRHTTLRRLREIDDALDITQVGNLRGYGL